MFKKNISKIISVLVLFIITGIMFSCVSTPEPKETEAPVEQKSEKKSPEVLFAEKLQHTLEKGTTEEALLLFETMPASLKKDYDINLLHASLLISVGRVEEASSVCDLLEKIDPNNANNLVLRSMIAKVSGNSDERKAILKEIIAKDPTNSDALVEMGNDQMLEHRYKLAVNYYEQAVKSDESNINAYLGYGQALYYLGRLEESKKAFDRMLEINPKSAMAWAYEAKLDMENEDYYDAAEKVKKAIDIEPDYADFWVDYGRDLYFMGKSSEAEKAWTKAIQLDPENFFVYIYRSALYDEQERCAEAIEDYKTIISLKPEYYYAYESIGVMYWHEQMWEEAGNAFLQAYKYKPQEPSYALMFSACLMKQKRDVEAKKFLQQALKNRDLTTLPGAVMRFYYDGLNAPQVIMKVRNEPNMIVRGKYMFYIAVYHEIWGDDLSAKTYYNEVVNTKAPMFFEYRMAEWKLKVKK